MKTFAVVFPGQGSQKKGMGKALFAANPDLVKAADQVLGYSIEALCLEDRDQKLNLTQYTQPALFVVNAMVFREVMAAEKRLPAFLAGHSLGEYNALVAAGVMGFSQGLSLVKKRGELMAEARNGGMAAVIGMDLDRIRAILDCPEFSRIALANQNTQVQTVVSGDKAQIEAAKPVFESHKGVRYVVLNVSGAFHAPPMAEAAKAFEAFLKDFSFEPPKIPVISNVLAAPYPDQEVESLLCRQMVSPVLWLDSMRYLKRQGVDRILEAGPGKVLTQMLKAIAEGDMP